MNDIDFVSNLKLRGSWGESGNQNIGLFKYQSTYGTGPTIVNNRHMFLVRQLHINQVL